MSWICKRCGHENAGAKDCCCCNAPRIYQKKPLRSYFCRKCGRIGWTTKLSKKVPCKNCGVLV